VAVSGPLEHFQQHALRASSTSIQSATYVAVFACDWLASSLRKGSTKVVGDVMYLMENGGYCINQFAECEGDVGGCDLPNARNQTSRITVRGALRFPSQSSSFERPIVRRSSLTG